MSVGGKWNRHGAAGRSLTDAQCEAAFGELRRRVADLLPFESWDVNMPEEEDALIKFLTARRYVVADAEAMLRGYARWHREYGAGNLLTVTSVLPAFTEHYPTAYGGHDREGRPIYVERPRGKGVALLLKAATADDWFRWHVYLMERSRQLVKHWRADQLCAILDLSEISTGVLLSPSTLAILRRFGEHDQAMYPEHIRHVFVINAPAAACGLWKLLQSVFDPVFREKIHLWGPKEWPAKLAKYVDPEGLPQCFGGHYPHYCPITHDVEAYRLPDPPTKAAA